MTIPRQKIIQLLTDNQCKQFGIYLNHEIWITPNNVVIRLPNGNRIHIDIVELIAIDQLDISMWEYDYWLGQIGFSN